MKRLTKIIIKVCKYLNNNVSIHPIKYYGASRKVFNFKDLNQINRLTRNILRWSCSHYKTNQENFRRYLSTKIN